MNVSTAFNKALRFTWPLFHFVAPVKPAIPEDFVMNAKKNTERKLSFELIAITLLFALALTFFVTFIVAYFNGKQILVAVNAFNEANFELILFSVVIILGFVLIVMKVREFTVLVREDKQEAQLPNGSGYKKRMRSQLYSEAKSETV